MPENQIDVGKEPKLVSLTPSEIEAWLVSHLASLLEMNPDEVDVTIPFERYGLDSEAAIVMSGDLQDLLGCNLDPTVLFDYPTIEVLAKYCFSLLS